MQCIFENLFNYFFRFLNDWYLSYFNEEFSLLISGYWMNEWIQNVRHLNCFQYSIQVWKLFGNDKRLKLLIINRMKFGVQAYYIQVAKYRKRVWSSNTSYFMNVVRSQRQYKSQFLNKWSKWRQKHVEMHAVKNSIE